MLIWLALSVVMAITAATVAAKKQRNAAGWFVLCALFWPTILILLALSSRAALKTCPACAEEVKAAAKVCRHCGNEFPAMPAGVPARKRSWWRDVPKREDLPPSFG
jgi:hypothetical protein